MTNALAWPADFCRALTGRRRVFFAFAAGAASALGFAPLNFFPVLLLGFAVLVLLLDGIDSPPPPFASQALLQAPPPPDASHRGGGRLASAFATGWAFAFGQYLIGCHWIGFAFLVNIPGVHAWQMPFALLILTAGLALYAGIACALAMLVWRPGPARILVFTILYAVSEWIRGHALTGFPWNLPGYGWGASLAVLQTTSLIGIYGLSLLTILLGASLADFTSRKTAALPLAMLALFAGLWAFGAWRMSENPTADVPGVNLRLVQPNIPQEEKDVAAMQRRNWQRLLDLSVAKAVVTPTHIIWPEAAAPNFLLDRSAAALDEIAILTGSSRVLMTGEVRAQPTLDGYLPFNSLYIYGPGASLRAVYDKAHPVPFGEYVPFASLLNKIGITKLTAGQVGFAAGDGLHTYQIPGAPPVMPLICYDDIFPEMPVTGSQRPGWFVIVTDDAWFGPWAGPYQHLLMAQVRAIENAMPVARAANTGISVVIDPVGRITASLGLGRMGVLDARLPKALPPSTYARYGDLGFALLLIFTMVLAFVVRRK
jgi:apolipoprotein N-acyltransferase